ncbi:LysR substrate-binding domain-containing protein [Acidimangrovimonas sediminis]|uniref:LysR substrate-binding domain-containing protein n=1 Tax=Acidimangrovimonas sediminis TaxID=2056283 RepID=UPI000C7FEF27|nr:LysR substrate-binding domain-containing protein [Acidimangrovimonas sediminis]
MRYTQIRAFHQVALHGGFSRAAEACGQSQPTLSDQVRALEQAYDVLLFRRDGRRVQLTGAGEALFRLTKRFFDVEDEIGQHLSRSRAALQGHLRIMADSAIHIVPVLSAFRRRHPGVRVEVQAGNSAQVLQALRAYDVEFGVLGSLEPMADLDILSLGAAPIVAITGEGFAGGVPARPAFAEIARHPVVLRERGSQTRQRVEAAARRAGVTLRPALEVAGREAMREVVASGLGVGFISEAEIGHDPRILRHRLDDPALEMTESLINLGMRRDLPLIRAFLHEARRPGG